MEFYNSKEIKKTRKEHKCFLCYVKIPINSNCHYESGKFDGDFFSRYSHKECSIEWNRQNREAEYGDEWGWFEDYKDGNPNDWKQKIKEVYESKNSLP